MAKSLLSQISKELESNFTNKERKMKTKKKAIMVAAVSLALVVFFTPESKGDSKEEECGRCVKIDSESISKPQKKENLTFFEKRKMFEQYQMFLDGHVGNEGCTLYDDSGPGRKKVGSYYDCSIQIYDRKKGIVAIGDEGLVNLKTRNALASGYHGFVWTKDRVVYGYHGNCFKEIFDLKSGP